jgi:oxaloacetate decarboxylase alpha subunit
MAGLLKPYEAFTLVAALRKAIDVPIQIHSHATTGLSVATLVKSVEAGALLLDTAISSLAMGTSHSPTETMVEIFKGTPHDTGLDTALLVEIAAYFRDVRRKYRQFESAFVGADTRILISQVPGGMLSNLESQLKEQGAGDKLDKVLHEIAVVQKDFGYPPLVTPTSQIVGTQAVLNVLFGRYERISNESRDLLVGNYGATPARPNEELVRKALIDAKLSAPVVTRPADAIPNEMGKIEKELCEKLGRTNVPVEDVLTYAMFPQVALKFFQTRAKGPVTFDAPAAETAAAKSAGPRAYTVTVDGADYAVSEDGGKLSVNGQAFAVSVKEGSAAATAAPVGGEGSQLLAPMPGVVIKFECKDGDAVQAGQSVLILEALKMQMPVKTRTAGRIKFRVHPGDHVRGDAVLADLV